MRVISTSIPSVYPNKKIASFFFPSIYNITGFPKTKNPVMAAEQTKSKSMAIGMIIVSSSFGKFLRENINDTTRTMYTAVPNESIRARVIILAILSNLLCII